MKKISNEVKVGFTVLVTIVSFIFLFNFLKGKDLFNSTAYYYAVYDKIGGLAESSPVEVNGYKVGIVQSIDFVDAVSGKLLVAFSVDRNFKLPKNTVAEVLPLSLIAGMKVQFVYGNGPGFYSDGDTIPGRLAVSIIDKVETELIPVKERITSLIVSADSAITSINKIMDEGFGKDLGETMSNLNSTTASIDNIIGTNEKELKATLGSVSKFSEMLSANTGKLNSTFSNLEAISDTLAAADIYTTISNLKASLEGASKMMNNLNSGKGSAGQLLTNDSLYMNLSNSLSSLNLLLEDMKANPKKYVHFSLF